MGVAGRLVSRDVDGGTSVVVGVAVDSSVGKGSVGSGAEVVGSTGALVGPPVHHEPEHVRQFSSDSAHHLPGPAKALSWQVPHMFEGSAAEKQQPAAPGAGAPGAAVVGPGVASGVGGFVGAVGEAVVGASVSGGGGVTGSTGAASASHQEPLPPEQARQLASERAHQLLTCAKDPGQQVPQASASFFAAKQHLLRLMASSGGALCSVTSGALAHHEPLQKYSQLNLPRPHHASADAMLKQSPHMSCEAPDERQQNPAPDPSSVALRTMAEWRWRRCTCSNTSSRTAGQAAPPPPTLVQLAAARPPPDAMSTPLAAPLARICQRSSATKGDIPLSRRVARASHDEEASLGCVC